MDIRHLRYFIGVAEAGSFTEAAKRLHIVQPALSQRMGDLEQELGVQLLVRARRGIALTPAGQELLGRARVIMKHIEYAASAVQEKAGEMTGTLNVGVLRSLTPIVGARLFRELRNAMPGVVIQIRSGYSQELRALLRTGELDLATVVPLRGGPGAGGAVFEELLHLVGPESLLGTLEPEVDIDALAPIPLLLSPKQPGYRHLMDAARHRGIQLNLCGGVEDSQTAFELCAILPCAAVLPEVLARRACTLRGLVSRPIKIQGSARRVQLMQQDDAAATGAILMAESILESILADVIGPPQPHPR